MWMGKWLREAWDLLFAREPAAIQNPWEGGTAPESRLYWATREERLMTAWLEAEGYKVEWPVGKTMPVVTKGEDV